MVSIGPDGNPVYTAADRELMEFGYDPWQMERFARLTPAQRIAALTKTLEMVAYVRRHNVLKP